MASLFEAYGLTDPAEQPKEPAPEPRGMTGVAKDVGISALKGAIAVPEAAVGLADLVTGGYAGKAAEAAGFRPAEAKAILQEQYSPEQKEAFARVQAAQGFGDTLLEAVRNPSVIGHSVVESLPSMGAGGVVARGGMALAPRLAPVIAGAIGEGATQAGSAAEQARQESPDGLLSARGAGAAVISGVLDTAIAAGSGGLAKRLGIVDVDTLLAGAKTNPVVAKGLTRRVLEGMATEGILEELPQSVQEQVLANYGAGKPLDEGVNQAAVLGMLSGGLMGGGVNALASAPKVPENGPLSRAANMAQPGPAVAAAAGMEAPAGAAPGTESVPGASAPQEPQVDPVLDRIKTLQGADRLEAMAAYNLLSRDDTPKGVRQYNSRLLDDLLAKVDAEAEKAKPLDFTPTKVDLEEVGTSLGAAPQRAPGIAFESPLSDGGLELQPTQEDATAAAKNIAMWSQRAEPMGLGRAQELRATGAEQGIDLAVVPHGSGVGYAVVPGRWVTPAMRAAVAQEPDTGFLPLDTSPSGVLRADQSGNVTPETRAQRIAIDAEAKRKRDLGLTPDVEAVQAGKTRAPLPQMQAGDVGVKSTGKPFGTPAAAQKAQAKSGGEIVRVRGGWVVRTQAAPTAQPVQQELEAGDGGTSAAGGLDSGVAGSGGGAAQRSEPVADAVGLDAGGGTAVPAAESGAVQDAGGEPAAAVAPAEPQYAVGDKVHMVNGLYFGSAGTVESISPTGRIVVRADNALKSGLSVTADQIAKGEKPAAQAEPEATKTKGKQPNGSDAKKAAALFTPKDATAPSGERWQSADAPAREALLLSAGWKTGSEGLAKMKAQAWDKMTQGQRTRIAKAMEAAPNTSAGSAENAAKSAPANEKTAAEPESGSTSDTAAAPSPEAEQAIQALRKRRQTLLALRRCLGA